MDECEGISMNKIKFSHKYSKIPEHADNAVLLAVFPTRYEDLGIDFVWYDTHKLGGGFYPLPLEGACLVLLFQSNLVVWTTIRRWNQRNEEYYRSKVGDLFEIEIKSPLGEGAE